MTSSDGQFIEAFENCSLPKEQWTHRAHVRMARYHLLRYPFDLALDKIRQGIQRYNASTGNSVGYHETVTQVYAQLISSRLGTEIHSWDSFEKQNSDLFDRASPPTLTFYQRETIASPEARARFVAPDLRPLPSRIAGIPIPPDNELFIETDRLHLGPITEVHSQELFVLFADPDLHRFVPFEPESIEKMAARCLKWSRRRSPDNSEIWLNWVARLRSTGAPVAHLQAGIKDPGFSSLGYLVGTPFQRTGIATEGCNAVMNFLRNKFGIREIRAWSDTRNEASHQLAKKLGMAQVDFIRNADHFKGSSSDEYVFLKRYES